MRKLKSKKIELKNLIFVFFCLITLTVNAQTNSPVSNQEKELFKQDIFNKVLQQLDLTEAEINLSLFVCDNLPQSTELSVMIVPKNIKKDDGSSVADFYILVVENSSGKIKHKYIESDTVWTSKIGVLPYITFPKFLIDKVPYQLNSEIQAFGIRANYSIISAANPYDLTHFSLFIPQADSLIPVLKDYPIYEHKGNFDFIAEGKEIINEGTIAIEKKQTNNLNNISITHKVTTKTSKKIDEDYKTKEHKEYKTIKLHFDKTEYK